MSTAVAYAESVKHASDVTLQQSEATHSSAWYAHVLNESMLQVHTQTLQLKTHSRRGGLAEES